MKFNRDSATSLFEIAGLGLIVYGISFLATWAALIIGGLALMLIGYALSS